MGQMNCDDTYIKTVAGTGVGWCVRSVNPLSRTTHPAYCYAWCKVDDIEWSILCLLDPNSNFINSTPIGRLLLSAPVALR